MTLSLLFNKRRTIQLAELELTYDAVNQISLLNVEGQLRPAIDQPLVLPTNSKTYREPADDDPDPGREDLY